MTQSANLGFPRIGAKRELKKATEAFWKGDISAEELKKTGAGLRARHWKLQKDAGIDIIPSNDFSFYDQVLDITAALGAVPPRFGHERGDVGREAYFAMARGAANAPAMEMTKWFDTNYHYIVPEFYEGQEFRLSSTKAVDEFNEAKALDVHTRPVLVGPVAYLSLGKAKADGLEPLSLLNKILPVYAELLAELKTAGADWVQIDEPILAMDISGDQRAALVIAYNELRKIGLNIMLAAYFEGLRDNLELAASLPVQGLHVDLVRAPDQLDAVLDALPPDTVLSLGLIDGRNIWRADLSAQYRLIEKAKAKRSPQKLQIAPSCSLLHTPVDLDLETGLDDESKSWLAFSKQKLEEVAMLAAAADDSRYAASDAFGESDAAARARASSRRIHDNAVKTRAAVVAGNDLKRENPFSLRREKQRTTVNLPPFPTTTIGSFPQTVEVRKARASFKRGDLARVAYDDFLKEEIEKTVRKQEALGLDVLVHGEFERNDMVEYFGEKLEGFAFTRHGWVQSYGSRYVKPPIIFGDVSRPEPMTVAWSAYAQSLTDRPVKGMLTGPVTILQWSFVRNDQPREETCKQIALAIRDEVVDLEKAGIRLIQIDEPALREGLPLRRGDREDYLSWAVDCFRLAAGAVSDETQIHTHMCYCEFNDIMPSIAALDADVISIETSRSDMELLDAFSGFDYPNDIGPGVWDIHSPRVPSVDEVEKLLAKAVKVIPAERLWVNPDCGLKTRSWEEVEPSLAAMVDAAKKLRGTP